jgi:hypothetical protein
LKLIFDKKQRKIKFIVQPVSGKKRQDGVVICSTEIFQETESSMVYV